MLKEDVEVAGKLNEVHASVCSTEDEGQVPVPAWTFSGREEVSKSEMTGGSRVVVPKLWVCAHSNLVQSHGDPLWLAGLQQTPPSLKETFSGNLARPGSSSCRFGPAGALSTAGLRLGLPEPRSLGEKEDAEPINDNDRTVVPASGSLGRPVFMWGSTQEVLRE